MQRPTNDASGLLLPRRCSAARRFFADAGCELSLHIGAEVVASSARFDDAANTRRMGGYALLNLTAEYQLGNRWTILARLDNALDKHYELATDFKTAGANAFVGVRWLYQ